MHFKENLKFLRESKTLTQQRLSEKVAISRSMIGQLEAGIIEEPTTAHLKKLSRFFKVSIDELLFKELERTGRSFKAAMELDAVQVKGMFLVPQKAAAGYLNGYSDPEYIGELPRMYLPQYRNGNYRAFEISGDSMLPVPDKAIIVCSPVEQLREIKREEAYIIVTKCDGIVFKRMELSQKKAKLISDNTLYEPYFIAVSDIIELWKGQSFISPLPRAGAFADLMEHAVNRLRK